MAIKYGLTPNAVLWDDKWIADQPVVEVDHLPGAKSVLGHPLNHVFASGPFLELSWLLHLRLENPDMLPAVVGRILEHCLAILVLQMDFVASLKIDVRPKHELVGVIMNMLLDSLSGKVIWVSDVLRNVADMTEASNLVRNVIIILRAVFPSHR